MDAYIITSIDEHCSHVCLAPPGHHDATSSHRRWWVPPSWNVLGNIWVFSSSSAYLNHSIFSNISLKVPALHWQSRTHRRTSSVQFASNLSFSFVVRIHDMYIYIYEYVIKNKYIYIYHINMHRILICIFCGFFWGDSTSSNPSLSGASARLSALNFISSP